MIETDRIKNALLNVNALYKGMKLDRNYTLEELGL